MSRSPPDPPDGVSNINSQPGVLDDTSVHNFKEDLKSSNGVGEKIFNKLTRFTSDEEEQDSPSEEWRESALSYLEECINYRDKIRPDSLRSREELPELVRRTTIGGWVWYNFTGSVEHSRPESDADTHDHGKYLFFTPEEAKELEDIVLEEFETRPYKSAKIPTILGKQEDWVLVLYQEDNRYWYDVRGAHHNPPRVRFRGFKTDSATRRGEYSEQFEQSHE